MPRGMSDAVCALIVQALARGLSREEISKVVDVSHRAITRVSTNLKRHGTPRPPPSGAKQGRPARMTRAQAEAMLEWMKERDYAFYVKDLVGFLRENYGYKGCDGTVRRELVRAGFRRKLPWHKSEITTWQPPNHPPDISHATASPTTTTISNPTPADDRHQDQRQTAQDQATQAIAQSSIDPGLESLLSDPIAAPPPQTSPPAQTQPQPHPPPHLQPLDPIPQTQPQSPAQTPHLNHTQPFNLPLTPPLPSQNPLPPFHPPSQNPYQPLPARHNATTTATKAAPAKRPRKPRNNNNDENASLAGEVTSLKGQLAQQQQLIDQLRMQLQTQPQVQVQVRSQEGQTTTQGRAGVEGHGCGGGGGDGGERMMGG